MGAIASVDTVDLRPVTRPRGPMDKASAYGAGDCRFESCRGHLSQARNGSLLGNLRLAVRMCRHVTVHC